MKPSRTTRIIQILIALQSGQNNRVCDLARLHGTSRRTIFRDLNELRDIGVPCRYDTRTGAYSVDPDFFLPPVNLNHREAMGLLLLAHKMRNHLELPFKQAILLAAMKLENSLPTKTRLYCNAALQRIFIIAGPRERADIPAQLFEQLIEAVLKKRVVRIHYFLPRERRSVVIEVRPYHLVYRGHGWYVVGKSSRCERVRAFRLSWIKELTICDGCFVEDEKFDIREHIGRAWSMVAEGRLYNVKLRFLPQVANDVAQVRWHDTQSVTWENDGSAILEFRVDGLGEITWWILSYGDQVQVLAPRDLRDKIVQIAEKTASINR
jgi:predicted DNA-binding transcriptional regulator YafY